MAATQLAATADAPATTTTQSNAPITFAGAVARFKAGDVVAANQEFMLLANYGLATADVNLGAMAAHGISAPPNPGDALGWYTAAQQLGAPVTQEQLSELRQQAGPAGQSRSAAIVAHYGLQGVKQRLLDEMAACRDNWREWRAANPARQEPTDFSPPKTDKRAAGWWAQYPHEGLYQGFPGAVVVRAWIDVDGRAKHALIEQSFPLSWREGFQQAVVVNLMHSRYTPAVVAGRPVASWKWFKFVFRINKDTMIESSAIKRLHTAAAHGDAAAEALWLILTRLGKTGADYTDGDEILVSSALKGFPESEADLYEHMCAPQPRSVWEIRAAMDGDPRVLAPLVEEAYRTTYQSTEQPQIAMLLDKAATSDEPAIVRKVVWVRAWAQDPGLRDATKALKLALGLNPANRFDPDFDLALAAAEAANSDFDAATEAQRRAVHKANDLGWDSAPLQATLKRYESRQVDATPPAEFRSTTVWQ